ncbi:MAG: site-2 protease family protein [Candidatus Thermoplasmatota archaeon]|nr:site-2 protease family protein [Candidatus Thermoplasmatota archaeon]MBS3790113.1 site-2 protease family protein [Candidatus Thermoplasmatota archaeon]
MKTSIKIGTIRGIPIKLHLTLLIAIGIIGWSVSSNVYEIAELIGVDSTGIAPGLESYLLGFAIAIGLFISVLIHELAHSFVGLKMGIKIREISLWLFGGVSNMEEIPREPNSEIKLSVVGPLTSLAIGIVSYAIGVFVSAPVLIFFFAYLGFINVFLFGFNMIPAFPMDGGRILRAVFAKKVSYAKATKRAADIGKVVAVLFAIIGLFYNIFLLLIAFFVYIGASQESQSVMMRETLEKVKVEDIMTRRVKTLSPDERASVVLNRFLKTHHHGFPVVKNGRVLGIVTLEDIKRLDDKDMEVVKVSEIMERDLICFEPEDDVSKVWNAMVKNDVGRFPVISDGELKGILTRSDLIRTYEAMQELDKFRGEEI